MSEISIPKEILGVCRNNGEVFSAPWSILILCRSTFVSLPLSSHAHHNSSVVNSLAHLFFESLSPPSDITTIQCEPVLIMLPPEIISLCMHFPSFCSSALPFPYFFWSTGCIIIIAFQLYLSCLLSLLFSFLVICLPLHWITAGKMYENVLCVTILASSYPHTNKSMRCLKYSLQKVWDIKRTEIMRIKKRFDIKNKAANSVRYAYLNYILIPGMLYIYAYTHSLHVPSSKECKCNVFISNKITRIIHNISKKWRIHEYENLFGKIHFQLWYRHSQVIFVGLFYDIPADGRQNIKKTIFYRDTPPLK